MHDQDIQAEWSAGHARKICSPLALIKNMDVSRLSVFGCMYVETMKRTSFESQKRMEPREIKIRKGTYVYRAGRYISLIVGKCVRNVSYNQKLPVPFGPIRFQGSPVEQCQERADRNSQWKKTTCSYIRTHTQYSRWKKRKYPPCKVENSKFHFMKSTYLRTRWKQTKKKKFFNACQTEDLPRYKVPGKVKRSGIQIPPCKTKK